MHAAPFVSVSTTITLCTKPDEARDLSPACGVPLIVVAWQRSVAERSAPRLHITLTLCHSHWTTHCGVPSGCLALWERCVPKTASVSRSVSSLGIAFRSGPASLPTARHGMPKGCPREVDVVEERACGEMRVNCGDKR